MKEKEIEVKNEIKTSEVPSQYSQDSILLNKINEEENNEIFQTLKPRIKDGIDGLFTLFKDNLKLFNIILDKCKTVTANEIRYFIMDYIGNTKENAAKIVQSSDYLYDITDSIVSYIPPVGKLTCEYIDSYSTELLVNISGDKLEME